MISNIPEQDNIHLNEQRKSKLVCLREGQRNTIPKLLCNSNGWAVFTEGFRPFNAPPMMTILEVSSCIDTYIGRMFIKKINMIHYFSYQCNCIYLTILKRQHRNFKFYSLSGEWHCFRQGTAIYVSTKQNLQGPLIIVTKLINFYCDYDLWPLTVQTHLDGLTFVGMDNQRESYRSLLAVFF